VPGNSTYLLWMILGDLVTSSVLVVSVGRLGDLFGRVRIVQGIGGAFLVGNSGAILTDAFRRRRLPVKRQTPRDARTWARRGQGWRPSSGPNERSTCSLSASASPGAVPTIRMIGSGLLYSETS
jgi:hypothetical protein